MADARHDPPVPPPNGAGGAAPRDPAGPSWLRPQTSPAGIMPDLPESRSYRVKRRLLGPPLVSEELRGERLSRPVALAVLSSDVMSSSAYATESILRILVPAAGLGAFTLITPVTGLILIVLAIVCLCYRLVVQAYPVSGGSYVVSRENFGYAVAQIPGAALLCSYTLTVAVSIAAGVDAIISAFPRLSPYPLELSVVFVALLTYGNLRGIREAGRVFAVPTYWFLASMAVLVLTGVARVAIDGRLPHVAHTAGHLEVGSAGSGLLLGASVFLFLRAFANGGSAMTGMEAISNAVTVFRDPQVRNARMTLGLMASILGAMFLGVSVLAALTHAIPTVSGTPTVLSEIGKDVFGSGGAGVVPYYSLQFSTALILILGANTSFNGFPLLVSFIAEDAYLPRPLTTRGHRLVFSNGIFVLAAVSLLLLVGSDAKVSNLIPLYACTVFTGFTMAGAGMARYHHRHRDLPGRNRNLFVSALAFAASAVVTLIFVATEFTRGAWLVVVVIPALVLTLARTHRRYEAERDVLAEDAAAVASEAPVLRNYVVVVLVDRLDLATARALQLARSIAAGRDLRAVHFILDEEHATRLKRAWGRLGLESLPLELIECRDRRLVRAAAEMAADLAADGETEVLVVLPRRAFRGLVSRMLHDNTADRIIAAVSTLPHVSATIAPFDVARLTRERERARQRRDRRPAPALPAPPAPDETPARPPAPAEAPARARTALAGVRHRERVHITGRVRAVRVQPWAGIPTFECILVDERGVLPVVFLGRRDVPGIRPGTLLSVTGIVGDHQGRLAMLNPEYEILGTDDGTPGGHA